MKTDIKVGDLMTRDFVSCSPETDAIVAIKKMCKNRVGSVVVKENNKLVGIMTERDVLVALTKRKNLEKVKVKEIMTSKKLVTISPRRDVYDAVILMKKKEIRRLPVIEKGKIIGLITIRDIIKTIPSLFDVWADAIRIKEEMRKIRIAGTEEEYYEKIK